MWWVASLAVVTACVGMDEDFEVVEKTKPPKDHCAKKPDKKKCTTQSATVGTSGGVLRLPDGLAVEIPAGALDRSTAITVTATTDAPDPSFGGRGTVYQFEPEGLRFARAVKVTLPVPSGMTDASVYWTKLASEQYEAIGGTRSGDLITASTFHFSLAQLGAPPYATPIRIQSVIAYHTNIAADLHFEYASPGQVEILVGDGMGGYAPFSAVQAFDGTGAPIAGELEVQGVPTGGDYIVHTGDTYLFTTGNSRRIDLGFERSGRIPERDRIGDGSELVDLQITGMKAWRPDDQIELLSPRADSLALEAQFAAVDPSDQPITIPDDATAARLRTPPDNVGGNHLLTTQTPLLVGQLSSGPSSNGHPYEAMSRLGSVTPSADLQVGGSLTMAVDLATNLTNDQTLRVDYHGSELRSTIEGTATEPGHPTIDAGCFFCGGFVGVLGHVGPPSTGFFGNNFDMMLLTDGDGVDFDTGTLQYGATSSLPGDSWHQLFLARWTSSVSYVLPDTFGPGNGAVVPQIFDWVTSPALVNDPTGLDPSRDIRPPLSRPRNVQVNTLPFYTGSPVKLNGPVTLTWDPPAKVPSYEDPDHPGTFLPSPVTYSVVIRKLAVNINNRTTGTRVAELSTTSTSLTIPDFLLSTAADATYIFILVAKAGTTYAGVTSIADMSRRASPDSVLVRTSSGIFGAARGTPLLNMSTLHDGMSFPSGMTVTANGVYWVETGESPFEAWTGARTGKVWRSDLDGQNLQLLSDGQDRPLAIAVDHANPDVIYWTNWGDGVHGTIEKLDLASCPALPCASGSIAVDEPNLTNTTLLEVGGELFFTGDGLRKLHPGDGASVQLDPAGNSHGLATDGTRIYWTDYGDYAPAADGRVLSILADGSGLAVPVTGASQAFEVQVDGSNIYWSNQGWPSSLASIERQQLGGGGRATVALGTAAPPLPVTASQIMKTFGIDGTYAYYIDRSRVLMRARLEGNNEVTTLGWLPVGGGPDGKIVVFDNAVYWTDYDSQAVHRAPL